MADTKKRRPLHFALSGALLVPGLAAGCGPDEEGPMINVPADDPPEVEVSANPVGEEPPPAPEPEQLVEPVEEQPPSPTANPVGDDSLLEALGVGMDDVRANPVGNPSGGTVGSE